MYPLIPDIWLYSTDQFPPEPPKDHFLIGGLSTSYHFGEEPNVSIAVIDRATGKHIAFERFCGPWRERRAHVDQTCRIYDLAAMWMEAAGPLQADIQAFQEQGLPIYPLTVTRSSKFEMFQALIDGMRRDERPLRFLRHYALMQQLHALRVEETPTGLTVRSDIEDDAAMALALAWYGCQRGGVAVRFA